MPDSIILAKSDIIERCIARAREELAASQDITRDFTRQDAAILNIERACEAAIDIANRIIHLRALGPPVSSKDSFLRLEQAGMISADLSVRLRNMVTFRNIAVHQYRRLDLRIVERVIEHALGDLLEFKDLALKLTPGDLGAS